MKFDRAEAAAVGASPPPEWLRDAVRELLLRAPGYAVLDSASRTNLARAMVQVGNMAAGLVAEERSAQAEIEQQSKPAATLERSRPAPLEHGASAPLARAQEQPGFGAAADRIADTTRNVLSAVSFPRFVTDLVNGVFRAMLDSSSQQMQMYVNLLNSVSTSLEGFERSQTSAPQVRQWVADKFPEQIEYDVPEIEPGETPDPDDVQEVRLRLRGGAAMPDPEQIRGTLGLQPEDAVDASNPEQLVPLARRTMARQRQSMLATMVQMGMQRIVIDSGRINASMRFHIDTRSVASEDRGSQFGMQNRVKASGSFGVGPWGASAEVENTISYVSTQRSQATEEINTDLELNSSVELNFRTDYLPLNRMTAPSQADRIRGASLNPAAETDPAVERGARQAAQRKDEQQRRSGLLTMPAMPAAKTPQLPRAVQPSKEQAQPEAEQGKPAPDEAQPPPKEQQMQTQTSTAQPQKPAPVQSPRTLALAEALDKQHRPPPRSQASDALGKQVLDLLWRSLEEDDEAGIWQRMKELRALFDAVPDTEAGALLARIGAGGKLQRDFDYRLHSASRRRLRAGLRARALRGGATQRLPLPPIPPPPYIPPHAQPPWLPPPIPAPLTPAPTAALSPQFIVGWKWSSERRRIGALSKLWSRARGLGKIGNVAKMVEPYFQLEAIPRVRAAVPGSRVIETKLLFQGSQLSGEIEAELDPLPATAKFEMEDGVPTIKLSAKGQVSRFEFEFEVAADGVLGALRGLLPNGPPLARFEAKTVVELGSHTLAGVNARLSVECELIAAIELRWSLGGILREMASQGAKSALRRLKDWFRSLLGRAIGLWGRRVWWLVGAGLLLWVLLDDDEPPDDDLERFDPQAWRDARRWAATQASPEILLAAIDEAGDAAQESFGTGMADTLRHLQTLGNRASEQLETMAAGPYGSANGFNNLPGLSDPFERWFVWSLTTDASRDRPSSIEMGVDKWRERMRLVQRVAMAGRAARASGRMSREAWSQLLGKIKWHSNAAGIACAVQFLRGWRDDNDFRFIDENGKRQHHNGSAQLTDAFKLLKGDGRNDDERSERVRRIAWMILAE